jgi:FMN phosphatase YigB (HAD superfamily)
MKNAMLFIDLDGVLVDFDLGVRRLFGRSPEAIPPGVMWGKLAKTPDFYNILPWMADGQELWQFVVPYNPTILTGLPMGKWAEPQKRAWCARELGVNVPVITCLAKEKQLHARSHAGAGVPMILVDDREKLRLAWEAEGGIFILHTSARTSIASLQKLGFGAGI